MLNPTGGVSISLGSVVLDRPDQTGQYIAKDLAGGWAYLIGDEDGDSRFRGHGVCDGGLDLTLRCGFLSAVSHVPKCNRMRIVVDTVPAHRMMVQLAVKDPRVVAAIAGRPVSVMTRPEARSSFQVRTAAEQAAAAVLRMRAEWDQENEDAITADPVGKRSRPEDIRSTAAGAGEPSLLNWRARFGAKSADAANADQPAGLRPQKAAFAVDMPVTVIRRVLRPLMDGARDGLAAAGVLAPRAVPQRRRAVMDWQRDLDAHVTMVTDDLLDAGI